MGPGLVVFHVLQVFGVRHRPTAPGFNAPVALLDGLVEVMRTIPKVRAAFIGKHFGHLVVQLGLALFEGQHIFRLLVNHLPGDALLAPSPKGYPVNSHDATGHGQSLQQGGDGRDFVGLGVDRLLGQHQPLGRRPGADQVQGALPTRPRPKGPRGAAHALAIDGYHLALGQLLELLHPLQETIFKRLGIQARKYPAESVMGGNSIWQIQHLFPPLLLGITEVGYFHPIVSSAYNRTHRHNYDILRPM